MKNILITGKGSYIGSNFKAYMEQFPNQYNVDELDMIDDKWKEFDFSEYDVIYHVAGIAHIQEKKENENLYFKINRDLAYEVAKKAKKAGISQFIFMSSMSIYGIIHSSTPINKNTECNPNTYYGKSKYEAETLILSLQDENFKICILRPPMVYGEGAPGNLSKLIKMVKKAHVFPTIKNQRSIISIEKLIKSVKELIDSNNSGLFLPQNNEYLCTFEVIKSIMKKDNVKVYYTSIFNPFIKFFIGKIRLFGKCFGDLVYEK